MEQTATYYDTPDLRLTRAGASLRYRDDDGWTVKLPDETGAGPLVRGEHVFGGGPATPPPGALELVAARVRTARLAPVVRLHTTRHRKVLRVAPGDGGPTDAEPTPGAALGILTDDDRAGRDLVVGWMRDLGLAVTIDAGAGPGRPAGEPQ